MPSRIDSLLPDLSAAGPPKRWLLLAAFTAAFTYILALGAFPAANLLGAMGAGILLAVAGGGVRIARPATFFCQSVIGCMVARSINREILSDIAEGWPLFILMVLSVSMVATVLGWLLARSQVLPGSTAIWGTSPGAALVMTLMSEGFGADSRLVAFMQYTRVVIVSLIATLLARFFGETGAVQQSAAVAADPNFVGVVQTLALSFAGMLAGVMVRIPAGPMLVPILIGSILNVYGVIQIVLPWWLLTFAYSMVGWSVGLRFTREIVRHAMRALPKVVASMLAMVLLCGLLAVILGRLAGIDPITAYLATSPGGMDAIAIIAASAGGDMSMVMAVQTTRFLIVSTTSPAIASFVTRRTGGKLREKSEK